VKKLIAFIPILAISYTITNTKIFSVTTKPDTLKTTLNISVSAKTLEEVLKSANVIISFSKNCKKINYSFSPAYQYTNKKRVFIGYNAYIFETCHFKNAKEFSTLLNNLSKYGKIDLTSIRYVSSNLNEIIKKLKIKAYDYALNESKTISKALNKKCILKNIKFNNLSPSSQPPFLAKPIRVKAIEAPTPKQQNETKLITTYQIECF